MDKQKYNNYPLTISQILGLIEANDIAIPEIQRPFVWRINHGGDKFADMHDGCGVGFGCDAWYCCDAWSGCDARPCRDARPCVSTMLRETNDVAENPNILVDVNDFPIPNVVQLFRF